jgi:hypothetical protein
MIISKNYKHFSAALVRILPKRECTYRELVMASRDKKQADKRDESTKSEILHRLKTHPFLFIGTVLVLIIVIVAFVFVPAMPGAAGRSGDLVFGYYDKVPIKYVQNNYFYQAQQTLYQRQQPSQDDPNFIYTWAQIWRQAFEETVIHMGILDELKQAGYTVPADVVDRNMAELPYFQENGRFSPTKFRAMDSSSRMNLWQQLQESITIGTYTDDLADLKTASKEAAFVSSMASPRRSFDCAIFSIQTYPDSEVLSYAQANPEMFLNMRLSKITVNSSEREARQILDSIKSGAVMFEEAARANSQDWAADRGGDMGALMAFELEYENIDREARGKIIALSTGELSDIIKNNTGWVFYRADEAAQPVDLSELSYQSRVRNYVMGNLRGRAEDWVIAEAEKFSATAREAGFSEAASADGIEIRSFGPIPLNYGNSAIFSSISSAGISELSGAGSNELFWRTAFSTLLNTASRPIVIDDNVIVLYPTEEVSADESEAEMIESYYSYWIRGSTENALRSYFLNNGKLDDRFQETFWKIWSPN